MSIRPARRGEYPTVPCERCNRTGRVTVKFQGHVLSVEVLSNDEPCPRCFGVGRMVLVLDGKK